MKIHDDELRRVLGYDPETGAFTWLVCRSRSARRGSTAGTLQKRGYVAIGFRKRVYRAHRLAWFFVYGEWPPTEIDHIDGDPTNNRISNLRLATRSQNNANTRCRRDSGSGVKGVGRHQKSGKWRARIEVNGKSKFLGLFDRIEDASNAYQRAAVQHFGAFANCTPHKGDEL